MRKLDTIVIHYSATPLTTDIGVEEITRWHKERGFRTIGYHYVVRLDGAIEYGRSIETVGAHVKGKNTGSIGICYIGGLVDGKGFDTRTDRQKKVLRQLVAGICNTLQTPLRVVGHNNLAATQCPGFDVTKESWPTSLDKV